jgi:hypothetical protein
MSSLPYNLIPKTRSDTPKNALHEFAFLMRNLLTIGYWFAGLVGSCVGVLPQTEVTNCEIAGSHVISYDEFRVPKNLLHPSSEYMYAGD